MEGDVHSLNKPIGRPTKMPKSRPSNQGTTHPKHKIAQVACENAELREENYLLKIDWVSLLKKSWESGDWVTLAKTTIKDSLWAD